MVLIFLQAVERVVTIIDDVEEWPPSVLEQESNKYDYI